MLCINDESTGQNIIAGSGELHVEICINDLREFSGIEIIQNNPIVSYKETVTEAFETRAMSKSANKHNRIYATAEPLDEELSLAIENGEVSFKMDPKERTKILVEKYGWDKSDTQKLWAFGPEGDGPNVIIDVTKGCQFMNEIKDSLVAGF